MKTTTHSKPGAAERLTRVESHLAHLERLCEEMNRALVEQGRVLARLQSQQRAIAETLEDREGERLRRTDPRPPHYQ